MSTQGFVLFQADSKSQLKSQSLRNGANSRVIWLITSGTGNAPDNLPGNVAYLTIWATLETNSTFSSCIDYWQIIPLWAVCFVFLALVSITIHIVTRITSRTAVNVWLRAKGAVRRLAFQAVFSWHIVTSRAEKDTGACVYCII